MLGLPDAVRGCRFDLVGVLTQTTKVHAAAWNKMSFLVGARALGVDLGQAAVFEEALGGVAGGRAGGFGCVAGIDLAELLDAA